MNPNLRSCLFACVGCIIVLSIFFYDVYSVLRDSEKTNLVDSFVPPLELTLQEVDSLEWKEQERATASCVVLAEAGFVEAGFRTASEAKFHGWSHESDHTYAYLVNDMQRDHAVLFLTPYQDGSWYITSNSSITALKTPPHIKETWRDTTDAAELLKLHLQERERGPMKDVSIASAWSEFARLYREETQFHINRGGPTRAELELLVRQSVGATDADAEADADKYEKFVNLIQMGWQRRVDEVREKNASSAQSE